VVMVLPGLFPRDEGESGHTPRSEPKIKECLKWRAGEAQMRDNPEGVSWILQLIRKTEEYFPSDLSCIQCIDKRKEKSVTK